MSDNSVEGYKPDLSDANMVSAYFAGQIDAGVKFVLPVVGDRCRLGIKASYEFGLTDTCGSKEKDGEANDLSQLFKNNYKLNGTRKFSGFEFQAMLSVLFSIFLKKNSVADDAQSQSVAAVTEPVSKLADKPC